MSGLNYKELQEQGIFDVPYKAFQFMQEQQAKIDLLEKEIIETQEFLNKQNYIKQAKIDELAKHVACIKTIVSECDENTDSSWILGNIDGFIECMEKILEGNS